MNHIYNIAQLISEYVMMYCITHYVFLEKNQKGIRQHYYNLVTVAVLAGCGFVFGNKASIVLVLAIGYDICLSRDSRRLLGAFLVAPILGIMDGLMLPLIVLPSLYFDVSTKSHILYQTTMCGLVIIAYLVFVIAGKNIRDRFEAEIDGRSLQTWERSLLCVVGALLLVFSLILNEQISRPNRNPEIIRNVYPIILLLGIMSFVMTLTVIVVVIAGNKQNFFQGKVSNMQFNIIVMMAEIVENRDENTGGHIRRTAKYVEIIAKQLKKNGKHPDVITDEYIDDIMVAAPLHDIGKIHVSDVILNKKGKLTDEEFEIMKTHSAAGRELLIHAKQHLGQFSYLDMAVDMAGSHHEWWDGSRKGYPDGISGEDIPLCARIMAVADVFDALISKRCYKDAMPIEKAFAIIREESGTHFDPDIVEAFFDAQDKIEKEWHKFESEDSHVHTMCE